MRRRVIRGLPPLSPHVHTGPFNIHAAGKCCDHFLIAAFSPSVRAHPPCLRSVTLSLLLCVAHSPPSLRIILETSSDALKGISALIPSLQPRKIESTPRYCGIPSAVNAKDLAELRRQLRILGAAVQAHYLLYRKRTHMLPGLDEAHVLEVYLEVFAQSQDAKATDFSELEVQAAVPELDPRLFAINTVLSEVDDTDLKVVEAVAAHPANQSSETAAGAPHPSVFTAGIDAQLEAPDLCHVHRRRCALATAGIDVSQGDRVDLPTVVSSYLTKPLTWASQLADILDTAPPALLARSVFDVEQREHGAHRAWFLRLRAGGTSRHSSRTVRNRAPEAIRRFGQAICDWRLEPKHLFVHQQADFGWDLVQERRGIEVGRWHGDERWASCVELIRLADRIGLEERMQRELKGGEERREREKRDKERWLPNSSWHLTLLPRPLKLSP